MFFCDIEANGLLDTVTKVHCIAWKKTDDAVVNSTHDFIKPSILSLYASQLPLVWHNGINYDCPALTKIYGVKFNQDLIIDTLVLSRLIYPDLGNNDDKLIKMNKLPTRLRGRHSLEAWGYRLGEAKGEYDGGWENWSQEMEDYCKQDVVVLEKLYNFLMSKI